MAGRPKTRARIAASLALPDRPRPVKAPSSVPGPTARSAPLPDPSDAKFGEALAQAVSQPGNNAMLGMFEELRMETMRFALEVMRMELDPDERGFTKLLGVKQQIATTMMTATMRVRPGDLREREDDGVAALLAKLKGGDALTADEPTAEDLLN